MFRSKELFPPIEDVDEYRDRQTKADDMIMHWQYSQKALRAFWDSWRTQYLLSLRERPVMHKQRAAEDLEPQIGMTVLLKDNLPRGMWRYGVITHLLPSADGKIRSAKVRLANGHVLARPLKLLCPLEMADAMPQTQTSQVQADAPAVAPATSTPKLQRPQRQAAQVSAQLTRQHLQQE